MKAKLILHVDIDSIEPLRAICENKNLSILNTTIRLYIKGLKVTDLSYEAANEFYDQNESR